MRRMFERFDDSARRAIVEAQEVARDLGHDYMGVEHLLVALLRHPESRVGRASEALDLFEIEARKAIVRAMGRGGHTEGQIPFTPGLKRVLETATFKARARPRVRDIDLALAAVEADDEVFSRVLSEVGVEAKALHDRLSRGVG
jgi:ATP-dependent Clp protease ATP-binding subunit ClpA